MNPSEPLIILHVEKFSSLDDFLGVILINTKMVEESYILGMPSIMVLSHTRNFHLIRTLESLAKNVGIADFNVILLAQDPNEKVLEVFKDSYFEHKSQYTINLPSNWSVQKKINMNMKLGIDLGISKFNSDWMLILEDDILLTPDALRFLKESEQIFHNNPRYRGTNCFSQMPPKIDKDEENAFVRLNYGVGWGWTINRFNYYQIQKFWTGLEEQHWDGFLEPYFRTGFVVNPWLSRCVNIGLDGSGSNTKVDTDLTKAMLLSSGNRIGLYLQGDLTETKTENFQWAGNCYQMSGLTNRKEQYVYFLFKIHFWLHRMYFADFTSKWKSVVLTKYRRFIDFLLKSGSQNSQSK